MSKSTMKKSHHRKDPWLPQHDGKKRCKYCRGTGHIVSDFHIFGPPSTFTCPDCGGKGFK